MLVLYMTLWSMVMVVGMGMWRLRRWRQVWAVAGVAAAVLLLSQTLFVHLATAAGVDPAAVFTHPSVFIHSGPMGWLALLVMPYGWLGPVIGLHLVQGRDDPAYQSPA